MLETLYTEILIKPVYNLMMFLYANTGQQAGLVMILLGLAVAALFVRSLITSYYDLQRTKNLSAQIDQIKLEVQDPGEQQSRILALLKQKGIAFKSESIFLFGLTVAVLIQYPVLVNYWAEFHPSLLYSFMPALNSFSPDFMGIDLSQSHPTLSLLPAILLFLELRQSYSEQRFLTNFIDRWYPVILPLCIYFLIFWLPASVSIFLTAALGFSLYLRLLLYIFSSMRHKPQVAK